MHRCHPEGNDGAAKASATGSGKSRRLEVDGEAVLHLQVLSVASISVP